MSLQALAKRDGVETIAKALLAKGHAMGISEREYTELMNAEATRKGQSFEAYFTDPANIDIRKAHQLTKSTLVAKDSLMRAVEVQPVSVETGRTDTKTDAKAAYAELMSMAEELAASGEYRSVASAFAALFSDQKNAELQRGHISVLLLPTLKPIRDAHVWLRRRRDEEHRSTQMSMPVPWLDGECHVNLTPSAGARATLLWRPATLDERR